MDLEIYTTLQHSYYPLLLPRQQLLHILNAPKPSKLMKAKSWSPRYVPSSSEPLTIHPQLWSPLPNVHSLRGRCRVPQLNALQGLAVLLLELFLSYTSALALCHVGQCKRRERLVIVPSERRQQEPDNLDFITSLQVNRTHIPTYHVTLINKLSIFNLKYICFSILPISELLVTQMVISNTLLIFIYPVENCQPIFSLSLSLCRSYAISIYFPLSPWLSSNERFFFIFSPCKQLVPPLLHSLLTFLFSALLYNKSHLPKPLGVTQNPPFLPQYPARQRNDKVKKGIYKWSAVWEGNCDSGFLGRGLEGWI